MDFKTYWMGYAILFALLIVAWGISTYIKAGRDMIKSSRDWCEWNQKIREQVARQKASTK